MRVWLLAILIGSSSLCGCGDDDDSSAADDEATRGKDAGTRRDGSASPSVDGGAGQVTDEAEIRGLLSEYVAQWDRVMRASCTCYVKMGAFPSEDTCFALVGSGPSWVDCGTRALVKRGTAYDRAGAECLIDANKGRADCLEAASCDDLTACDRFMMQCPAGNEEITTLVIEECPDLGILSRLDGGA